MKRILVTLCLVAVTLASYSQNAFEQLIDVKHYTINLDISDFEGQTINGYTKINLQTTQPDLTSICLYLQALTVDSVVCSRWQVENFSHNDTVLTINFTNSIVAEQDFDLTIYYHGQPVKDAYGFGGFYFSGEYAFNMGCAFSDVPHNYGRVWFPCNDNFTDKAKYKTIITTQTGKTAISSGELVDINEDSQNGKTTYTWQLSHEIPTYLQSVAVGEYYHYHSEYQGIERTIPIDIYGYPGDSSRIATAFAKLDTTMQVFEQHFGAFPWQRVGYVLVNFASGAMEHACNISLGRLFVTSGTYEELYYHELSHQWFGNIVTCETAEDMWLNEGFATYCETLWTEFVLSKEDAVKYRRDAHHKVLTKIHLPNYDGEYLPLSPNPVYNTYSSNVYDKGASVVHTLRNYLGDSTFFAMIKQYMTHFAFKTANSQQFCNFIMQTTGTDMQDFFDSWVFTKGFPHYAIDSVQISPNNSNFDVTVFIKQKLLQRENFTNRNRVELTFMNSDFVTETRILQFDGEAGNQIFSLPFRPVLVLCDYYEKTSDATIDEAKFLTETGSVTFNRTDCNMSVSSISDTAFVRVTCNFVAPDDFKSSIAGLTIVPSRYWLVESLQKGNFDAEMNFSFNSNDNSGWEKPFLQSANLDSLCLLYRRGKSENWQVVEARYFKGSQRFRVPHFAAGEYALAIRNGYNKISQVKARNFSIFPNPSYSKITVDFGQAFSGDIIILDTNSRQIMQQPIEGESIVIDIASLTSGNYFVVAKNANWCATKRIVKIEK